MTFKMISCAQCREEKLPALFYKNRNTKDGFDCLCKKCRDAKRKISKLKRQKEVENEVREL